jgi:hypothetical protein
VCLLDGIHEDLAVPDHAASQAAKTDARIAAEEDERDKKEKVGRNGIMAK